MIGFLRHLIFKDFFLKLFSLALAVLIWVTISIAIRNEVSPIGTLTLNLDQYTFPGVPVTVLSSAADVRNYHVNPKEVDVTVQGDPRVLRKLQTKDIRALVDLTGVSEGQGDLVEHIEVSTPSGVTHVRVVPSEVRIIFPGQR